MSPNTVNPALLKSEHLLLYACGLFTVVLLSVSFISIMNKYSPRVEKNQTASTGAYIYDPDHGLNISIICPLSTDAYRIRYDSSPCQNRTLSHWYLPWVRYELWKNFWKKANERRRSVRSMAELMTRSNNDTKSNFSTSENVPATNSSKSVGDKLKQKPSEVLYTVLVGLLMLSAVGACWEAIKTKLQRVEGGEGENNGVGGAKVQERNCSLAEFTMNRHLRRESLQQQQNSGSSHIPRQASFELHAKVTQNLTRQSSLDRTLTKLISEAVTSVAERRYSSPSSPTVETSRSPSLQLSSQNFRRQQSFDGEFISENVILDQEKKKPRHFIRRH